ncbi:MAG: Nif3-like dinuclear metal center hexameric protein [Oscillospiraceae bacterium]|nr:Nif3-like dinuclear metal center hexameric protein [Oscillospiraceae bacterium]
MVNALEIYKLLDSRFPFSTQEEWDNSGLLINSGMRTDKILVCLDVTPQVVDKAIETGAKLIVSSIYSCSPYTLDCCPLPILLFSTSAVPQRLPWLPLPVPCFF